MKCMLLSDHHADTSTISEADRPKLKFWIRKKPHPTKGLVTVTIPYFPAGTIFEHDVVGFILRGMAAPADDEAAQACGLDATQLAALQKKYNRLKAGIAEEDFELFDAGVITGYVHETGEYVPGPNWQAWKDAQDAEAAQQTSGTDV